MYMRGARVTFTNETMKNSVVSFMSKQIDPTEGMIISFRAHLSENQIIHIMVWGSLSSRMHFKNFTPRGCLDF